MTRYQRLKIAAYTIVIVILAAFNIYLLVSRTIPTTIDYSIDIRYNRVRDIMNHQWAGVEEFPSMLFCLFPLAFFPTIESAKIGWMVANFAFILIILFCLRKTFLQEISTADFIIFSLIFNCSVPAATAIMNGQNLLFSFAFFMLSYWLSSKSADEHYAKNGERHLVDVRGILCGILLGISYFKYSSIFFLVPIFIYKRKYVELISSVLLHVVLNIFAIFWLDTSLLFIITSPILNSLNTNVGEGFIDLMTIMSTKAAFLKDYASTVYLIVLLLVFGVMLYIAVRRTCEDELLVFSLYCAMSTVLIYHRQYDLFLLIIPMHYLISEFRKYSDSGSRKPANIIEMSIMLVSLVGVVTVLLGNWFFKYLGISIEYGIGFTLFYSCSVIGIYLLCMYLLIKALVAKA